MAKDAVATMGTILTEDVGGRDAVHVAVISATAGEPLWPAQHVKVNTSAEPLTASLPEVDDQTIGIVDPFLPGKKVAKGERFWLYLYPRTITSLRHNWTHPAFADAPVNTIYSPPSAQLDSKEWIRNFAEPYGVTYQDMVDAAKDYLKTGEYFCRGGAFEGERVPDEFWIHYERATGQLVDAADRDSFFTCSC